MGNTATAAELDRIDALEEHYHLDASEVRPEGMPSEGEPAGMPSEGEPAGMPSEGEPAGMPSEGEPEGMPSELCVRQARAAAGRPQPHAPSIASGNSGDSR